mgnify:CR=1 FL=1
MRKKDELAIDKIMECAKQEFLEKGFEGSSMRDIAEKAGYTTGMLYGRFADKSELFKALVESSAEKLYDYYTDARENFETLSPDKQFLGMRGYEESRAKEIIAILYDNFEEFKLIICKSKGSEYEKYADRLIAVETERTVRFIEALRDAGIKVKEVRADLSHMLSTAMLNGMFEVIEHDFTKEEAMQYIGQLHCFFNAGWNSLLGLSSENR